MSEEIISTSAIEFLGQVNTLLDKLVVAEAGLESGYARLGYLLSEVSEKGYWRASYESFGDYIAELGGRFSYKRTQLYNFMSTVKELRPYLTEDQLNGMGIAKAGELAKSVRQSGFPPNAETLAKVSDPKVSVKEVRKLLFEDSLPAPEDKSWYDFQGFHVTVDERKVIDAAFNAAWRTDPVVAQSLHESIRRKEAILRLSMEYLSTYQDAVEEGTA